MATRAVDNIGDDAFAAGAERVHRRAERGAAAGANAVAKGNIGGGGASVPKTDFRSAHAFLESRMGDRRKIMQGNAPQGEGAGPGGGAVAAVASRAMPSAEPRVGKVAPPKTRTKKKKKESAKQPDEKPEERAVGSLNTTDRDRMTILAGPGSDNASKVDIRTPESSLDKTLANDIDHEIGKLEREETDRVDLPLLNQKKSNFKRNVAIISIIAVLVIAGLVFLFKKEGVIAGVVGTAVVVLGIVASVLTYRYLKKREERRQSKEVEETVQEAETIRQASRQAQKEELERWRGSVERRKKADSEEERAVVVVANNGTGAPKSAGPPAFIPEVTKESMKNMRNYHKTATARDEHTFNLY